MSNKILGNLRFMIYAILVISFSLNSCVTNYGPLNLSGGYEELKLNQNLYVVTYYSDEYEAADINFLYCLFRCSELTILDSMNYFTVLNEKDLTKTRVTGGGSMVASGGAGYATFSANKEEKPITELRIKMSKEPIDENNSFNAREFIKTNKDKIKPSKRLIKERGKNWSVLDE